MARDYWTQCRSCTKSVPAGRDVCDWCGTEVDPDTTADRLTGVMFRVAMLRDLTADLTDKDKRALDAAYQSLAGVAKRRGVEV